MATFYLILVIILFVLAFSDLVVGVSNDAVNFLNSAMGAKASSFKVIIFVAALGVLVGATFSVGMMEVARKGIFHPEHFYFSEIIILFLAVMVTDVILLDTFNTYGMPTSTTVSIVFELLGAAVAISTIKIYTDPNALDLGEYINSAKALAIISGILVSVVVAFSCGMIAQYVSRMMFSFDYEHRMKKFGPLWGGVGITAIIYFMLIKGASGASFISEDFLKMFYEQTQRILIYTLVGVTGILFLLNRLLKIDILKVLVLVGTFALAMAFAGNDLVNFIGVPLAGYNAYEIFVASATPAEELLMNGLAGQVATPTFMLLIAGLVMVLTLYLSKKARSVIKTSLDLARQDEGAERFGSYMLSRTIVRKASSLANTINSALPAAWKQSFSRRFDQTPFTRKQVNLGNDAPAFDMIRASVTLVISSSLIAIGTNLKLPLSTTYVTFMVFMGTSLADGAWGRESAVYRVTGVLSVIGGWFFTAFSAFLVAFIMALIFYFGGIVGIVGMIAVSGIFIYRTHILHTTKLADQVDLEKEVQAGNLTKAHVVNLCATQLKSFLKQYGELTEKSLHALGQENLTALNSIFQTYKPILRKVETLKINSSNALDKMPENELEAGHLYILVIDYLSEMGKQVNLILKSNLSHVDNNHKPIHQDQIDELSMLHAVLKEQYTKIIDIFKNLDEKQVLEIYANLPLFMRQIRTIRKQQIRRIKNHEVGTRNSVLFLNHLGELRNLALFSTRIVRVFDELILNPSEEGEFVPADIRKELKEMRREAKSISETDSRSEEDTSSLARHLVPEDDNHAHPAEDNGAGVPEIDSAEEDPAQKPK